MPLVVVAYLALFLSAGDIDRTLAATVWVRAGRDGVGTGWVCSSQGHILTCRHLVGDRNVVEVVFPHWQKGGWQCDRLAVEGARQDEEKAGRWLMARVVQRSTELDLALLKIEKLPPNVRPLPIAAAPSAQGTRVHSVGQRNDSEVLWLTAFGEICQRGRMLETYHWKGEKLATSGRGLFLSLPIQRGDSGGPVVDQSGQVVGMISALRFAEMPLAYAIDAATLRTWLGLKSQVDVPVESLQYSFMWVDPSATRGRRGGVVVDATQRLILTTATDLTLHQLIEILAPLPDPDRADEPRGEFAAYADRLQLRLDGRLVPGIVVALDATDNLALVQLPAWPAFTLTAIPLAESVVRLGESGKAWQHLSDILWLQTTTTLRQRQHSPAREWWQLSTGPLGGGAILNTRGALIGLLDGHSLADQQMSRAVPISVIRRFLKSVPETTLSWTLLERYGPATFWPNARFFDSLSAAAPERRQAQALAAQENFTAALDLWPDQALWRGQLANQLSKERKFRQARAMIDTALAARPLSPQLHRIAAEVAMREGDDIRLIHTLIVGRRITGESMSWRIVFINMASQIRDDWPDQYQRLAQLHDNFAFQSALIDDTFDSRAALPFTAWPISASGIDRRQLFWQHRP